MAFIVTEIGLNHLGDSEYADAYLDNIIKSKPDAITFQIREKSFYNNLKDRKHYLNLPYEYYSKAKKICDKNKIKFGIALADETLIDLFENIDVNFYKILSKDIGNFSLLSKLGKTEKKLFLSTGLAGVNEIEKGLKSIGNFEEKTTLIHTQLSHSVDHVNLKSIPFLQQTFTMPVGYGHHSANSNVLYLALAFNPSAIFFYVKGDKPISHPDEEHSTMLNQLSDVVKNLNQLPKCFGSYSKSKMNTKIKNMK